MTTAEEIIAKIREVEKTPDGRLKTLRLQSLWVLLARVQGGRL